jgi:hypothetical protein
MKSGRIEQAIQTISGFIIQAMPPAINITITNERRSTKKFDRLAIVRFLGSTTTAAAR